MCPENDVQWGAGGRGGTDNTWTRGVVGRKPRCPVIASTTASCSLNMGCALSLSTARAHILPQHSGATAHVQQHTTIYSTCEESSPTLSYYTLPPTGHLSCRTPSSAFRVDVMDHPAPVPTVLDNRCTPQLCTIVYEAPPPPHTQNTGCTTWYPSNLYAAPPPPHPTTTIPTTNLLMYRSGMTCPFQASSVVPVRAEVDADCCPAVPVVNCVSGYSQSRPEARGRGQMRWQRSEASGHIVRA